MVTKRTNMFSTACGFSPYFLLTSESLGCFLDARQIEPSVGCVFYYTAQPKRGQVGNGNMGKLELYRLLPHVFLTLVCHLKSVV